MKRELYRALNLPVLQNRTFPDRVSARESASADIVLVQDSVSGLIFNDAFDPAALTYDSDYQNEQAYSAEFQLHLDSVEKIIDNHFKGQDLIEVGCGKGYFLELLKKRGHSVTGIDPAYEGSRLDVIKAPFTRALNLSADGLILRHVLEHIKNPIDFLASMADANRGGKIYIEVPCFDWIINHQAWFDLFYEHVNYFRLEDFYRFFGVVHEAGRLFGGQYLYVVADLASLRFSPDVPAAEVTLSEDFTGSLASVIESIRSASEVGSAIWGASSKGVIFSLFLQRAGVVVDHVVDINPAKQGRYLPLSGLQVSSPEQLMAKLPDGSHVFVMNSNYLKEIREMTEARYVYHAVDVLS